MRVSEDVVAVLRAKFEAVLPHLDERGQRLVMAAEARSLGHGGIAAVHRATGASTTRITAGVAELESGEGPLDRVRRPGAGRKPVAVTDAGLVPALLSLVATVAIPLMTRAVIDGPVRHQDQQHLWTLGSAAMALLVAEAVLWFIRRWLISRATMGVEADIRKDLYALGYPPALVKRSLYLMDASVGASRKPALLPDPEQDAKIAALLVKHGLMAEAGA